MLWAEMLKCTIPPVGNGGMVKSGPLPTSMPSSGKDTKCIIAKSAAVR